MVSIKLVKDDILVYKKLRKNESPNFCLELPCWDTSDLVLISQNTLFNVHPKLAVKQFQRFPSMNIRPDQPPHQRSSHIYFVCLPDSKGNSKQLTLWTGFLCATPSTLSCVVQTGQASPSATCIGFSSFTGAWAGCVFSFCHELYLSRTSAEVRRPALPSTCGRMAEHRPEVEDS